MHRITLAVLCAGALGPANLRHSASRHFGGFCFSRHASDGTVPSRARYSLRFQSSPDTRMGGCFCHGYPPSAIW